MAKTPEFSFWSSGVYVYITRKGPGTVFFFFCIQCFVGGRGGGPLPLLRLGVAPYEKGSERGQAGPPGWKSTRSDEAKEPVTNVARRLESVSVRSQ